MFFCTGRAGWQDWSTQDGEEFKESMTSLSQRVARSGYWLFNLRILDQIFNFIRTIILARLLIPADFGVFGIAILAMSILETFSTTGFDSALIQKKEKIEDYLDIAWTLSIIRGLTLSIIIYLIAPFTGIFFNNTSAVPIIKVIGLSVLLSGISNIGIIYFQKELEFKKQVIYLLSGTIVELTVAVILAFLLQSVWALVFGLLAGSFVRLLVSYIVHPYRPSLKFDFEKAKELFGFGKWVWGASALVFLLTHGDDILVGKILGVAALGFYQMAYRITNMPATEISNIISQVSFPAYSKLQDNLSKLREAYIKVLHLTILVSFPLAGGIFILSPEFTKIFLGEKWMPMVPAMQVLALYGLLRALGGTTGAVFLGIGKPEISTKIKLGQLILLAVIIYPLTVKFGILGTSIAVTVYALVFNIFAVYKVLNIVKSGYKEVVKTAAFTILSTLIMIFTILCVKVYLLHNFTLLPFFISVIAGVITYTLVTFLFDRFLKYDSIKLIKEQIRAVFGTS